MSDLLNTVWATAGNLLISAVTTSVLLAVAGYLLRDVLLNQIRQRTQSYYQKDVARLQSSLDRERDDLAELRRLVASDFAARNDFLFRKQVQSAEELWKATCENKKRSTPALYLQVIKVDEVNRRIDLHKDNYIECFSKIGDVAGVKRLVEQSKSELDSFTINQQVDILRIFVSPISWALYSAYSAVINHAIATFLAWQQGLSTKDLLKNEELVTTVKLALPHQVDFLNERGVNGVYFLLEELEENIMKEIQLSLSTPGSSNETMERAARIIESAKSALETSITHPSSAPR